MCTRALIILVTVSWTCFSMARSFLYQEPAAVLYEIWQKIIPLAFQLVPRDERGWVQLGLISVYKQFIAVSLVAFKTCNNHRSTNSMCF